MAADLVRRLLAGERRALARALTHVENQSAAGYEVLRLLYPHTGRAHTIGITGGAGAGKSTLTNALAKEYRRRGKTVGIIAVDPSSPFSRGAILGDRIRMQELTGDPGVFMRSMATRGSLGGLSETAADAVAVMDAFGKDVVLLETVGAGQDEVEVASAAQTTILVLTPGTGDDVQTMKAGIMEIADILVVNKSDLPNADLLARQIASIVDAAPGERRTPILRTAGALNEGIGELVDAIDEHRDYITRSDVRAGHRLAQARHQVLALARQRLIDRLVADHDADGRLAALVEQVAAHAIDPHTAADRLVGT